MDALEQRALTRGLVTFVGVALIGSTIVWLGGRGDAGSVAPTASPPPTSSAAPVPTPEAWLVWVPGGLPPGFGDLVSTVPDVTSATTATADVAWMTASLDANGDGVDQPEPPMMIPMDVTGVDPTFAAFLPEPERQLVENLRPGQGILSESEANLRKLGPGSTLLFRGEQKVEVVGTLPDALMAACADAGLLILTCGRVHEVMRWIPPLDVTAAEIAEAVEIFGETLARMPRT